MTERRRPNRAAQSAADQRRARRAANAARASAVTAKRPWWQNPRMLILVVAVIGFGAFVALGFVSRASAKTYTCDEIVPMPPGGMSPEGIEQPPLGNAHVPPGSTIDYLLCPPASGPHYSAANAGPLRPGVYGPNQKADPGGWVHNLEHGFIVVLYRGEPDSATMGQLQAFYDAFPAVSPSGCTKYKKLLVARFDDMATPFAVLSWQRLLLLETWDQGTALTFTSRWFETGSPEATLC